MIDYLMYDKKNGLIWICILKVMNFIIFRDFFGIFLISYELIYIYFEFKRIKKIKFDFVLTWQMMWRERK